MCLVLLKPNHVYVAGRPSDQRVGKVSVGLHWVPLYLSQNYPRQHSRRNGRESILFCHTTFPLLIITLCCRLATSCTLSSEWKFCDWRCIHSTARFSKRSNRSLCNVMGATVLKEKYNDFHWLTDMELAPYN